MQTQEIMIREDKAEYIMEELFTHDCIPESKRTESINVITRALVDIQRVKQKPKQKETITLQKIIKQYELEDKTIILHNGLIEEEEQDGECCRE